MSDWSPAEYVPTQKGVTCLSEIYQAITLIPLGSKVLLNIILQCLKPFLKKEIAKVKVGFRTGHDRKDHLHKLHMICLFS